MSTKTVSLPEGYTDKTSGFYVPEELRDYYQALEPVQGKDLGRVLEKFARTIANSRVPEGTDSREYWQEVDNILAEADMRGSLHVHYLGKAADKYQRALQYQERDARQTEKSRCPICDEITLHTPDNPVARRSTRLLAPALIEQPGDLNSCLKCYLTVMDSKSALAASEKVGKSTRKQLAEKVLATL